MYEFRPHQEKHDNKNKLCKEISQEELKAHFINNMITNTLINGLAVTLANQDLFVSRIFHQLPFLLISIFDISINYKSYKKVKELDKIRIKKNDTDLIRGLKIKYWKRINKILKFNFLFRKLTIGLHSSILLLYASTTIMNYSIPISPLSVFFIHTYATGVKSLSDIYTFLNMFAITELYKEELNNLNKLKDKIN